MTVKHPDYGLTFARILGQDTWDPASTSVAGLVYGRSYAVMTLRPPHDTGGPNYDVKDIDLAGGTVVTVQNGDVGTNANMEYESGVNSVMNIDPDYGMYYMDAIPLWESLPAPAADAYGAEAHRPPMKIRTTTALQVIHYPSNTRA